MYLSVGWGGAVICLLTLFSRSGQRWRCRWVQVGRLLKPIFSAPTPQQDHVHQVLAPPPPSPRQDNLHQVPAGPGLPWDTHRPRANHGPIRGGLPWPGGAQVGQGTGPDTCFCHPLALHAVCIGPPCPCPAFPCYPQHLAQTLLPSTSRSNAAQTLAQTLLPSTSRSNAATHHVFTSFHLTTPPGPNHLCLPAGSPATRWQCSRTSHTRCVCV